MVIRCITATLFFLFSVRLAMGFGDGDLRRRFDILRCIPELESADKGLRDWCEDLRNDEEMLRQEDYDYDRFDWIQQLKK